MNLERVIAVRTDKTIYRDGDRCIKVFGSEYSKADVLNEALNQARIEATGLRIPRILEVTMVDGKWAIVSDYIKGKTVAQLMKECPEKREEYIDLLVSLQMDIHSKTEPQLNKLKDKMARKLAMSDFPATTRYDLYTRLEGMPKHDKVCHGDFNPENVVITEDGTPFILDWSHATKGNASADIAHTYLSFLLAGDEAGAEYYLTTFCEKSGTEKEYVMKWMPIVAAAQSTKGNENKRELLMSWASAFDRH
jgi:RIO-like serine/threonine protein kinase